MNKMMKMLSVFMVALLGLSPALALTEDVSTDRERSAIKDAIANEDYETWKELMTAQLTEEKFEKLVELHKMKQDLRETHDELKEARKAGDEERVNELREELKEDMPEDARKKIGFWKRLRFWRSQ